MQKSLLTSCDGSKSFCSSRHTVTGVRSLRYREERSMDSTSTAERLLSERGIS